jgi:hypothetical protein
MLGHRFALALSILSLALTGCAGGVYQASAGARFELDAAREINDEDVQKAFAAAPQLHEKSRVAYFTFDDEKAGDVERMLSSLPHVEGTYRIPALLVTGKRRFQESSPWEQPQELSVKKLRLLAARAHADVLVLFDYGYKGAGANALCALNGLILPALFVPFLSNETESYAQAQVIDVRNGYLYGEVSADDQSGSEYVTIYARTSKDLFEEAWPGLLARVKVEIGKTLTPGPAGALRGRAPAPIDTALASARP